MHFPVKERQTDRETLCDVWLDNGGEHIWSHTKK